MRGDARGTEKRGRAKWPREGVIRLDDTAYVPRRPSGAALSPGHGVDHQSYEGIERLGLICDRITPFRDFSLDIVYLMAFDSCARIF